MVSVKGSVLRARLALVEELAASEGTRRVLARLSDADRGVLESLLASAWYPFELGKRLDQAIVEGVMQRRPIQGQFGDTLAVYDQADVVFLHVCV